METYDFLLQLIREAGDLLEARKREQFAVGMKHDNPRDVVSEVDVVVGEFITGRIRVAYPAHSIHNEEATDISGNEFQWTIDPIDGTASFVRGIPQYSIAIGLLQNGEPVMGAVFDPVARELFSFKKGEGAFLNGQPIVVSDKTELKDCYVLLAAGRKSDQFEWAGESLKKLLSHVNKVKNFGSSALWLCYVAAGRVEGVVAGTFSTKDVAAAVGILKEAGGMLTTATGEAVAFESAPARVYVANTESVCTQLRNLLESD